MAYKKLYSLIGTRFGGNGKTTFALPDLRSRTIMGLSDGSTTPGATGGSETIALDTTNIPNPTISTVCSSTGNSQWPAGNYFAPTEGSAPIYGAAPAASNVPVSVTASGGADVAHSNMQPSLPLNWCICVYGVYPGHTAPFASAYLSEIKAFAYSFVPNNFAPCDGRAMSINSNSGLFSLIGAAFGGNGTTRTGQLLHGH